MPRVTGFSRVVRVSCGNFLEMYDFMVFGYYAAAIGQAFFPSRSAFASLMLSLDDVRRRVPDAAARGDRARRLCRSTRPPRRACS